MIYENINDPVARAIATSDWKEAFTETDDIEPIQTKRIKKSKPKGKRFRRTKKQIAFENELFKFINRE